MESSAPGGSKAKCETSGFLLPPASGGLSDTDVSPWNGSSDHIRGRRTIDMMRSIATFRGKGILPEGLPKLRKYRNTYSSASYKRAMFFYECL